jgi:RND family efflux transporter MFP subunit
MEKKWLRRSWFILPVIVALVFLFVAPKMKSPPVKVEVQERATKVRVMEASRLPVVLRAVGYGRTQPARTWEAVAEVAGQVAWISEDLKGGKIIDQGTELLRIDDASYQLALTQVETQLTALEVKDRTTRASLDLEERGQALLKADIERKRKLREQGTLSASVFEEAERSLLKGEVLVQNLKNALALNAAERGVLQTQKANAELDLQRTRFFAPFDARITERKVNHAQYANKGQLLFSADGLDAVEIEARFPIGKLRPLMGGTKQGEDDTPVVNRVPGALQLEARVRLKTATHSVEWDARVDRVSGLVDPQTQTLGIVVVVDKPYEQARPGQRPPLVRNTFVEVELRKQPRGKPLIIPTSALHDGKVYILDDDSRLEIRQVKTLFIQAGAAAIGKGLEPGETLVVSDLVPASPGMLLAPQVDEKAMKRLKVEATGQKARTP